MAMAVLSSVAAPTDHDRSRCTVVWWVEWWIDGSWISSRPWLVVAVAVLSGGACLGANAAGRWIHVACFGGTVAAMHGMNVLLGTVYLQQRRTVRIV
jgi:hypothetical protein